MEFKQKAILFCGIVIIIFTFIPWWYHPKYNAFWIPLIGMYIGSPLNHFVSVNFWYYVFTAMTLFGAILICLEQKNHKIAFYGAIIATVSAFIFMCIFIAGTCDLDRPYFILDSLIADAAAKENTDTAEALRNLKIAIEIGMFFQMLNGYILSLNYATQFYFGSIPILMGALASIVAW